MSETLLYILSFGALVLIVLISIGGFYIVMILRDVSKIVSRVDQLSKVTKDIATVPLYAVLGFIKNNKWLKSILSKVKENIKVKENSNEEER